MSKDESYIPLEQGMRLHYRIFDDGQETVLIANARMLIEEYQPLAPGRRLVFYDQRGRGGSSAITDESMIWTDYEVSDIEIIRLYLDMKSFAIIGWSYMGAMVALYAQECSRWVSRIILVCPMPIRQPAPYEAEQEKAWEQAESKIDPDQLRKLEEMQRDGREQSDPISFCRQHNRVYFPRQMADVKAIDRMVSDPCIYRNEWPKNVAEHWQRHFPAETRTHDWRDRLSSLQIPALVIHGSEDLIPLASSKEWVATMPNARLLVIPGCGHFPHLEAPDIFFAAIGDFLEGRWPEEAVRVGE